LFCQLFLFQIPKGWGPAILTVAEAASESLLLEGAHGCPDGWAAGFGQAGEIGGGEGAIEVFGPEYLG
jgi:hypothetical protein